MKRFFKQVALDVTTMIDIERPPWIGQRVTVLVSPIQGSMVEVHIAPQHALGATFFRPSAYVGRYSTEYFDVPFTNGRYWMEVTG